MIKIWSQPDLGSNLDDSVGCVSYVSEPISYLQNGDAEL